MIHKTKKKQNKSCKTIFNLPINLTPSSGTMGTTITISAYEIFILCNLAKNSATISKFKKFLCNHKIFISIGSTQVPFYTSSDLQFIIQIPSDTPTGIIDINVCVAKIAFKNSKSCRHNSCVKSCNRSCNRSCNNPSNNSHIKLLCCLSGTFNVTSTLIPPIITGTSSPVAPLATLTITGTNFVPGNTTVTINGIQVLILSGETTTQVQFIIPLGTQAGTNTVMVITPGGSDSSTIIVSSTPVPPACILGTANSFAVLGASAVTNTGPSVVTGDLGVYPGSSISGFPPGIVIGVIYPGDAVAMQAQTDALNAYNTLSEGSCTANVPAELGGSTLGPGIYCVSSSAQITGNLTLDAGADPNALFVFRIPSTLTTAHNSNVILINEANPCNVFFLVGSSATLLSNTTFIGTIIAVASITLVTSSSVNGSLFALNGAITLDTNAITRPTCTCT